MKTRNKLLTLLILAAGDAAATACINKAIKLSAISRHILETETNTPLCYHWRFGNIYYTKEGTGKPILLIHDLSPASSGYEWKEFAKRLAKDRTVYTIDLLGFGRSEKPNLTYTNYLYVQLISDFIKSEIGHRTDVAAAGDSSSIAIMACSNTPELFDRLLLINPESLLSCSLVPGKNARLYKLILDLPLAGTLIYNIACSRKNLTRDFMSRCFCNPYSVNSRLIDAYYESAHLGASPKSVYASVKCNYTKCNITNALRRIDNSICLFGGEELDSMAETMEEYQTYNPAIETVPVPKSRYLPHLESPSRFYELFRPYLEN